MAKSARSSDRKRNNANLRAKVFGPASDARTARLSAKLQELAAKPKPETEKDMEIDEEGVATQTEDNAKAQDIDVEMAGVPSSHKRKNKKVTSNRIEKKGTSRRKPRNLMVFPTSAAKRKRIAQSKKRSV